MKMHKCMSDKIILDTTLLHIIQYANKYPCEVIRSLKNFGGEK